MPCILLHCTTIQAQEPEWYGTIDACNKALARNNSKHSKAKNIKVIDHQILKACTVRHAVLRRMHDGWGVISDRYYWIGAFAVFEALRHEWWCNAAMCTLVACLKYSQSFVSLQLSLIQAFGLGPESTILP